MLSHIFSTPQVRGRSSTHTQSLPRHRPSLRPSQHASRHVPLAPLYHTLGDHTCSPKPPKHLPPLWASTGRRPNTISADKSPVLRTGSLGVSTTGLQCSTRGSALCAH